MTGDGLRAWWREASRRLKQQHDRFLPLGDYVVDRWERAEAYGFGAGTSVYDSCVVIGRVDVGSDTWIGPFTLLDGSGGLTIGSGCALSAGVQVYSHDTVQRTVTGGQQDVQRSPTVIGDRVYIGPHTVVQRGVTIGDGVVVGAHSLVNRDLPAGAVAFGVPCLVREIRTEPSIHDVEDPQ